MGMLEQRRRERIRREVIAQLQRLKDSQKDHPWLNRDPEVRALLQSIVLAGL
jgi:hypothetical protein